MCICGRKNQDLLDQNNQAMNKTQFLHEPQSDCSQSPEKTCCFPFCMMGNLHPSDRTSCYLVPWALHCLTSHSPLNTHMTFYHLPPLFKKGEAKVEGFQRDGEGVKGSIATVLESLTVGLVGLHALI